MIHRSLIQNMKNLNIIFRFCTQGTSKNQTKRRFINIKKLINQEKQQKINLTNQFHKKSFKQLQQNGFQTIDAKNNEQNLYNKKFDHLSTQQQQFNHKIKTFINTSSLYQFQQKNKHKLEPRHYSLIFNKIFQLRKNNPKQRQQTKKIKQFLDNIFIKKIDKMAPEDLIRIIFSLKQLNLGIMKSQIEMILPILDKIIDEFSNSGKSQLQPNSFQTFRFSANIKLFHSLSYVLEHTGFQFDKKIKEIMRQILNYILFRSLKNKKQTKNGEYFSVPLKMSFLSQCKKIEAPNASVKNLIISILSQKQDIQLNLNRNLLSLQNLLQIEQILCSHTQLFEKIKTQLFTQKDIHTQYNIFFRIQKYIQDQFPSSPSILTKNSHSYNELNKKLIDHLFTIENLSLDQLLKLQLNSHKDQQIFKTLSIFNIAYKNCIIENYTSLNQKQQAIKFFKKSQKQNFTGYHLLRFFYQKIQKQGVNSLKPSIKKELKQFLNFLCKFFTKISYPTQTMLIKLLIISAYPSSSLKPLLSSYFQSNINSSSFNNTHNNNNKSNKQNYFFTSQRLFKTQLFLDFLTLKFNKLGLEQDQLLFKKFQLFVNSNVKDIVKFIMKRTQRNNVEKLACLLAQYCKNNNNNDGIDLVLAKDIMEIVEKIYIKISWGNRSFSKNDVEAIFTKKQQYMNEQFANLLNIEQKDQTAIFQQNVNKKQEQSIFEAQYILPQLENDKNIFKQDYILQQKIRIKIRKTFQNFKFLILFYENLKQISPSISQTLLTKDHYIRLISNFKNQLECLKFQKLFTKQNCEDALQIYKLVQPYWNEVSSNIQIRSQFVKLRNEQKRQESLQKQLQKSSHQLKPTNLEAKIEQNLEPNIEMKKQPQQQQQQQNIQIIDQDQQETQDYQYTEQISFLNGKDLMELEVMKIFIQKEGKAENFFKAKNNQVYQEVIQTFNSEKDEQKIKQLSEIIKSNNVFYLASADSTLIKSSNLSIFKKLIFDHPQIRIKYQVTIFKNEYISLKNYKQKGQQNSNLQKVYLNIKKIRKHKKVLVNQELI